MTDYYSWLLLADTAYDSGYDAGYRLGQTFGVMIICIPVLLGVVKCFKIMKRPETSSLCVSALVVLLCTIILNWVAGAAIKYFELPQVVNILILLVVGLGLFSSSGLAIVGLVVYATNRERYQQGRAQAIWALVLSLLFLCALVAVFLYGFLQKAGTNEIAEYDEQALAKNETDSAGVLSDEGELLYDDLNFSLAKPPRPWYSLDPKLINEDTTLCFSNSKAKCTFMIVGEKLGAESELTSEGLAEIAQGTIRGAGTEVTISDNRIETADGLEFVVFDSIVRGIAVPEDKYEYVHWVTEHNGYCYQLITFSHRSGGESLTKVAAEMAERFSIIDRERVYYGSGFSAVEPFDDPALGMRIDLSEKDWKEWDDPAEEYPEAQFTAARGTTINMGLVGVDLGELDPSIDELAQGMLSEIFNQAYPEDVGPPRKITQGVSSGYAINNRIDANADEIYDYRFRILRSGSLAYFLSAWVLGGDQEDIDVLETTLDSVEIYHPPEGAEPRDYPEHVMINKGLLINQIGLACYRRSNFSKAQKFFENAYAINPDDADFLGNIADAAIEGQRSAELIPFFEEQSKNFPDNETVGAYLAELYAEAGKRDDALDAWESLFAGGCEDEDYLLSYISLLVDGDERDAALKVISDFRQVATDPSVRVDRWESQVLGQLERYDDAIALLSKALKENPDDHRLAFDLIESKIDAAHYVEALEDIDLLVADGHSGVDIHFLKGRSQLGLDWYKRARTSFEEAATFDPNNEEVTEYLEYTISALGRSDTALIKAPIEMVELPPEVTAIQAKLESLAEGTLDEGFGYQYLKRIVGLTLSPDKQSKRTTRSTVRLLDEAGINRFSTLEFRFDPHYQSIFVNEVVVHDATGKEVARGSVDDYYIVDDLDDGMATTEKIVNIPVPGLKPGHRLSYTVTIEDTGRIDSFDFESFPMARSGPSCGVIVYLNGNRSHVRWEKSPQVKQLEAGDALTIWHTENPRHLLYENQQPRYEDFSPYLWLCGAETTWQGEGADYLRELDESFKSDQETVGKLATELTANLSGREEKIYAVTRHVQDTLTYQGLEFGKRARIPNSPKTTLDNRYGDCKDHSLLLQRLLSATGVEAHLALVSTGTNVKADLPSLDQFDHMVVFVPKLGNSSGRFIDCTSKYFAGGEFPATATADEPVLVLDPDNIRLVEGESVRPQDNVISSTREVMPVTGKPDRIHVSELLEFRGVMAANMRSWLKNRQPATRKAEMGRVLEHDGAPEVLDLTVGNLDNLYAPLTVQMKYELRRHLRNGANGTLQMRWPAVWESYFLREHDTGERRNPFENVFPLRFESRLALKADASAWLVKTAAPQKRETSLPFVIWTSEAGGWNESKAELHQNFEIIAGQFTAEQWAEHVDAIDAGLAVWEERIDLMPIEPKSDESPSEE